MTLTHEENQAIKVLNYLATYDRIIMEQDIEYILRQGIEKFIPAKRRHLVTIDTTSYPLRIKKYRQ